MSLRCIEVRTHKSIQLSPGILKMQLNGTNSRHNACTDPSLESIQEKPRFRHHSFMYLHLCLAITSTSHILKYLLLRVDGRAMCRKRPDPTQGYSVKLRSVESGWPELAQIGFPEG